MKLGDYECKTTFWSDFTIADRFGIPAIKDTYRRAFNDWKHDIIYMTELVMVLNWKTWEANANNDTPLCKCYRGLWNEANDYCWNNFKGDDLTYFYTTTD